MKNKCFFCNFPNIDTIGPVQTDSRYYFQKSILKVCTGCGVYWIDPIPNERQLSQIYAGVYHYDPNKIRDILLSLYAFPELLSDFNLVRKYKKEGKVLDIGAGRGDFLLMFPEKDWERWVFDPYLSESDIKLMKGKVGPKVNDYLRLEDYPKNTFDVIVLRNIVEHTAKFRELLRETYRLLKKGGVLFIRTPNMGSLDFKRFKNDWYVITMSGHIVFFDKNSLSKYVQKQKFRIRAINPNRHSAPLSYFRSHKSSIPIPIKLILSFLYSFTSPLFGEGGDLRMIALK